MSTNTYEHKGVTINFRVSDAQFVTMVGTKHLKAPSLDAIKKKIEAEQAVAFQPFKAVEYIDGAFVVYNVLHVAKGEHRFNRGDLVFITDHTRGYQREQHHVVIDTPENRALLEAASNKHEQVNNEKHRLDAELEAARRAIPHVHARDYGVKK